MTTKKLQNIEDFLLPKIMDYVNVKLQSVSQATKNSRDKTNERLRILESNKEKLTSKLASISGIVKSQESQIDLVNDDIDKLFAGQSALLKYLKLEEVTKEKIDRIEIRKIKKQK